MGDYLGNLIGKSLNQTPVVQPRRASWFAPSPYTAGAAAQADFGAPYPARLPMDGGSRSPSRQPGWVAEDDQTDQLGREHLLRPPTSFSFETEPSDTVAAQPEGLDTATFSTGEPTPAIASPVAMPKPTRRSRMARLRVPSAPEQTIRQPPAAPAPTDEPTALNLPHPLLPLAENNSENSVPRPQTLSVERRTARTHDAQRQTILPANTAATNALSPHRHDPQPATTAVRRTPLNAPTQSTPAQMPRSIGHNESALPVGPEQVIRSTRVVERQAAHPQPIMPTPPLREGSERRESPTINVTQRPQQPVGLLPSVVNDARLATIRIARAIPAEDRSNVASTSLTPQESDTSQVKTRMTNIQNDLAADTAPRAGLEQIAKNASAQPTPTNSTTHTARPLPSTTGVPSLPQPVIQPVVTPRSANLLRPQPSAAPADGSGALSRARIHAVARPSVMENETLSPPSTIHVTIGRIEVRATPPPATSARKQSTPPVMSLNDYLQARNGGSR